MSLFICLTIISAALLTLIWTIALCLAAREYELPEDEVWRVTGQKPPNVIDINSRRGPRHG